MNNADPAEVKRRLALSVATLAERLLPDGHIEGMEWRGHGPDGAAWGVVLRGRKIGYWQNFGAGVGGTSLLSLIRDVVCNGDHKVAWTWALEFLGDSSIGHIPPERRAPAAPPAKPADTGKGMWLAASPFAWSGPVGQYLQGRGIDPMRFTRELGSLRFHQSCWCAEIQAHGPAMLAAILNPITREHMATHRTWITPTPDNRWAKAGLIAPKKVVGSFAGGFIPLTRGASDRPWKTMRPGETLVLAEGIENALTVAQFYPGARSAAYVAAGNLLNVDLPEQIEHIILVRDRDGFNPPINDARGLAIGCWREEGREVSVWEPPLDYHDANDYWRAIQREVGDGERIADGQGVGHVEADGHARGA